MVPRKRVAAENGKSRVFEVIRDKIREDLLGGLISLGDKLPAERELAEKLGFSRTAVREALRGLEATGIIELQKGVKGGAFIKSGGQDNIARSINDVIILEKVPLGQVMEVRSLLLEHAVKLACERAKVEEFDSIERNVNETELATDLSALKEHVAEFYTLLGALSGNAVLTLLIDATTSIALDFAVDHKVEFPTDLIRLRRNVLMRLRARDAGGAMRAISENIAFLHGWVIARSTNR